ncbi:MAG: hypothetical protein J6Q33_07340 [Alistipes sp.]|nr:hypothetical protein [Alistipes sp.]
MKTKLFALAALVLGMVSCQKEINGIAVDKNGEAAVTISVALPEEGATRAGGSDSAVGAIGNIDLVNDYDIRYILEVYDKNDDLAKRIEQFEAESTQTSFALRLVPGRHYRFVVWADFVLQGSEDALHYNAENLTCVSLIEGSESYYSPMDETRDAYTGIYDTEKEGDREVFDSSSNIAITLTRPFAKLRVVTTDMNEIYSDLVRATVSYTSPLYNTFDALNATAMGDDTNVTKVVDFSTMTYANEPTDDGKQTLFADYLFGAEDDRVMFTLDVEDATGLDIPTVTFNTNIPVQRNYLTTVAGPILTDSNNITVTIEQGFAGYHDVFVKVESAEELANAIENAEDGVETVIEITDDIDITDLFAGLLSTRANKFEAAITIPASKNICLNIADKDVTYSSDYMNGAMIQNNGKLTIKGTTGSLVYTYTGDADTANANGNYAINNAGELNIDANISIVADKAVEGQKFSHALYVVNNGNGGKVNFDGGLVYNAFGYAVREFGDGDLTVNGGEIKGTRAIWLQLPSSNPSLAPAINLTVNGGKLTSTGESGGYQLAVYSYNYGSKLNNVNIVVNDGDIDGDIALTGGTNKEEIENVTIYGGRVRDIYSYGDYEKAKESIVIYGGSFEYDPSAYVAYGYAAVYANNVWTVEKCVDIVGDKYEIYSAAGLKWLADEVNSRNNYFEGKNVVLTADIDLAGYNWTPIGSATQEHGFMGNFDGNGKVVKNLTIANPTLDSDGYAYAGLFGVTEYNTIKNLTIENVNISTEGHIVAAAIAYPYYTVVENVVVKGDIQIDGDNYVAGVLGYTRRCYEAANLTIEGNEGSTISGGITIGGVLSDLQSNGGAVDYSNFKASDLTISGDKCVGGISGIISGQTLNGATVENVTICCSDARKGQIAGAVGEESFITEVNVKNVTGAENLVGATYDSGKTGKVTIDGVVYEYKADGTIVCTVAELNGEKYNSLAEAFAVAATMENAEVKLLADAEWATGAGIGSTPLIGEDAKTKVLTINGNGKTFTATGNGVGAIRMANGGKLVFNNVVIVDKSVSYAEDNWEFLYLEFAGTLEFNNCKVENGIMVENGGNATFNSCEFNSYKENEYDVWVSEAKAYFNNCDVNGYRGIKVHEQYGSEVEEVVIDRCRFNNLTKKPGVALGTLNAATTIKIMNSTFTNCKAGDQGLYIYETDTDVKTFTFVNENNTVL